MALTAGDRQEAEGLAEKLEELAGAAGLFLIEDAYGRLQGQIDSAERKHPDALSIDKIARHVEKLVTWTTTRSWRALKRRPG